MKSRFQRCISLGVIVVFLLIASGLLLLNSRFKLTAMAQDSTPQEQFNTVKAIESLHTKVKTSREKHLTKLRKEIEGRESEPASKVLRM